MVRVPFSRQTVLLLSLVAVLIALPTAEARPGTGRRLVPAGSTPVRPFGDGMRLVYAATPESIVSRDPLAHRATTFAFKGGCAVAGAEAGAALVTCELPRNGADGGAASYHQPYVLVLRSGQRVMVASPDGGPVAGGVVHEDFDDLGRQWLHAETGVMGCYHCEGEAFVNWHTGERRDRATFPTPPRPADLDDPDLRPLPAGTVAAQGQTRVVARYGGRLELQTPGRPARVLTRCAGACLPVTLYRDRAAWIQRLGHGDRARWTVRRALVPTGRVTRWPLPLQGCAAGDRPVVAFADGGLYVSGCRERAGGRRPLYHAR